MTRYQLHVRRWDSCTRCFLSDTRKRVCHVRGDVPADVLFVGEAPGDVEDVAGSPFVGRAGELLDKLIARAMPVAPVRVAITNLIGCYPGKDEDRKFNEPPEESIYKCAPRLVELIRIVDPRAIVCVGKHSEDYLTTPGSLSLREKLPTVCPVCRSIQFRSPSGITCPNGHGGVDGLDIPMVSVVHPAAILRAKEVQQDMMFRRAVSTVTRIFEDVSTGTVPESEVPPF